MSLISSRNTLPDCLSAVMTGTDYALKEATSPKGILEHIINFFTRGGVTKYNEKICDQIVNNMEKLFVGLDYDDIKCSESFTLDDIHGCKIIFRNSRDNPEKVLIEVTKNSAKESQEINAKNFYDAYRMLTIRRQCQLPQLTAMYTEEGRLNLKNVNLAGLNLARTDLSNFDLSYSNLSATNLSDADLSNANLSGADLSKSTLCRSKLTGSILAAANLKDIDMSHVDTSRVKIGNTLFTDEGDE